VSQFIHSAL